MNRIATLPLLIALAFTAPLAAWAQSDASAADNAATGGSGDKAFEQADRAERQRIANERAAAYARYGDDRRACWQRFAVNACLDQARERRRATTDALRRDELALNAQERERRTAARLGELAGKQAARADAPAAPASAP